MKKTNPKFKKGLSLVELIIYISIVAIVLVAITNLATQLVFAQNKTNKNSVVAQNLNFAANKIESDAADASAITGNYPANTLNLTINGHNLIYALTNNALTLSRDGATAVPITSNQVKVTPLAGSGSIFFKLVNGSSNTIQLQMQVRLVSDPNQKQAAQVTVLMRGK